MKSVPAIVKSAHSDLVAELKKAAKELDAALSTQRLRLGRQLLSQNTRCFDYWKAWYTGRTSRGGAWTQCSNCDRSSGNQKLLQYLQQITVPIGPGPKLSLHRQGLPAFR